MLVDTWPRWQRNILMVLLLLGVTGVEALLERSAASTRLRPETSSLAHIIPKNVFKLLVVGTTLFFGIFSRRGWSLAYALVYLLPLITWHAAQFGDYARVVWVVFGIIPVLETVCGSETGNPTAEEARVLNANRGFRYMTWLWAPLQLAFIYWAVYYAATAQLSGGDFAWFCISIGINTGVVGINIAHELIHKTSPFEQFLGKALLVSVCYGHFFVEHLQGHHKNVSTRHDPASSRRGEILYTFLPRSVLGSFRSAWNIEADRLRASKKAVWTSENQILQFVLISAAIALGFYLRYGTIGLRFFLWQSFVAILMLEVVNYIEHYGLARKPFSYTKKAADGTTVQVQSHEPVNPTHSWNADARITNLFLFKLQRHSDHHAFAMRRYQILRTWPVAPQMPTGYAGMFVMALLPPLWFAVMHPLLDSYTKALAATDVSRALQQSEDVET